MAQALVHDPRTGLPAAYELRETLGAEHRITVVNATDYFQFVPSNPWIAVGWRQREAITLPIAPLLEKKGIGFVDCGTSGGMRATSAAVAVTVAIPLPDTTPPTVSLASSSTSVVAPASITLTASATDNVGVTSVLFYEGSTLLVTKTAPPYTHDIAYGTAQAGTHVYTAKAFDAAGNSTVSATSSGVPSRRSGVRWPPLPYPTWC